MTTRSIVRVTDDTTREDLAETLAIVNGEAKAIRRRGFVGVYGSDYTHKHELLNDLLGDWEAAS